MDWPSLARPAIRRRGLTLLSRSAAGRLRSLSLGLRTPLWLLGLLLPPPFPLIWFVGVRPAPCRMFPTRAEVCWTSW